MNNQVGLEIKKARLYRKLTQKQLADKLGTKQEAVARWENGKQLPTTKTLDKIGQVLGATSLTIELKDLVGTTKYY